MKDVQCYELFGEIALKNHAFSFQCQELFVGLQNAELISFSMIAFLQPLSSIK